MSLNAIEILEERRRRGQPVEYLHHSPEWWAMMWAKHEEWREYAYPAATEFEVTPPSGTIPK